MKNAIVTGGAGLLGRYHIESLIEIGYFVYIADTNLKESKKLSAEMNLKYGKSCTAEIFLDVTSSKSINNAIKKIKIVDVLINNAAINPTFGKINKQKSKNLNSHFINYKNWDKELSVGLTGYLKCTVSFGNLMLRKKNGIILNIASDLSLIAPNQEIYNENINFYEKYKPASYSIIKHGVIGLTKYFASFWAKDNIRVNALSPGGVFDNQPKSFIKKLTKLIPMKRMANKDEYKSAIKFLCSDDSSYMTGQNVIIDGGRSIW